MSDNNMPTVFEFDQDISNAEAPAPLPVGTYRGVIKNVEVKASKRDPNLFNAAVQFAVSPDQYPADYTDGDPDGVVLTYYVSLANKPQARFGLRKFCESINAPMSRSIDVTSWLGSEAMVKVEHEDYEGRMLARINRGGVQPA